MLALLQNYTAYRASLIARRRGQFSVGITNNDAGFIDLKEAVQRNLLISNRLRSPYLLTQDDLGDAVNILRVCENVTFITDLITGRGLNEYKAIRQTWLTACKTDLSEAFSSIDRVTMATKDVITVYWNVTFVPDSIISLVWFCRRLPGKKINFFNVLDKERMTSSFSWSRLRAFILRLFTNEVVELPHAVIVGKTELSFRQLEIGEPYSECDSFQSQSMTTLSSRYQKRWVLTSSKEKINLVRSIDAGILKNRKLATDLLQYLDAQKPQTVALADWNDVLVGRINTGGIPGMGQFDIDGLDGKLVDTAFHVPLYSIHPASLNCFPITHISTNSAAKKTLTVILFLHAAGQQKELLTSANKVIGGATLIVFLCGAALSTIVFDSLFSYHSS